ncbi:MAG: signal transduction protein [Thermoplasmata archaeon]|nr:signal transduction protein [Thermoplasmata archaeon]RLF73138.1 MAG: signal transduction protein [Thermoplasmata archaeon]HDD60083.1 signal transduction protein [Euryarchaeota archaeon]
MFQNTIRGINKIFKTNNYENLIILVTGYTGTMKSTFTYNIISRFLENHPEYIALYATIEESQTSLLKNIKSIGIPTNDRIFIADYNKTRELYRDESEHTDFLELTERLVVSTKEEHGDAFKIFALDSLNALYSLMRMEGEGYLRKRIYYFFKLLRDQKLTSFIIKELPREPTISTTESENFLADGVVELGVRRTLEGKKRYVEVIKMRQNEHSMRQFILEVGPGGLSVIGPSVDDMSI